MNKNNFKKRCDYLCQQIGECGAAILFASSKKERNKKIFYPYRQDSNFYYLTGFTEPQAIAVFIPKRPEGEFILFNRENDPVKELWRGKRAGQLGACNDYGADQAFSIDLAETMLPQLIAGCQKIYCNFNKENLAYVANLLEQLKRSSSAMETAQLINLDVLIHEMRLCKDEEEMVLLKKASNIIAEAQRKIMCTCKADMCEYELEAEILYECVKSGARFQSFPSIVAGGANACILHYEDNNAVLRNGELVLIDCGAEYEFYASDITRTIPINGRFNLEQKIIYQAVLDVQLAVIKYIKPGVKWIELQQLAEKVITQKLLEIGLLQGNLEELIAQQAFLPFFMHKIGHWIGLDVHDVGWYKSEEQWRELKPNMLMTIEPGIYIADNIPNIDFKWKNIGIRIEDTVLITEKGCEVLTGAAPKAIDEIESLMKSFK